MSKRDDILNATMQLFWENGYESTSPRDIQKISGAGQGSFYHHFKSKRDLAREVIGEVVADRIGLFERDISGSGSIRQRIDRFLAQDKVPLRGCRIGRMVWDNSVVDDPKLREPIARYFRHIETRLTEELLSAVDAGEVELLVPAEQLALMIITMLQGGFTISRASQVPRVNDVIATLQGTLDAVMIEK